MFSTPFLNLSTLNDVHVLIVDHDYDTRFLYTTLFKQCGVTAIATRSITEALDLLKWFVPDLLICEIRFPCERVEPLICHVRTIAQNHCKVIPVFVISTFPVQNLAKCVMVEVEAYQIKPIDLNQLIDEVWNLLLQAKATRVVDVQPELTNLNVGKKSSCCCLQVE